MKKSEIMINAAKKLNLDIVDIKAIARGEICPKSFSGIPVLKK